MANAIKKTADVNGIFQYVESINTPDYPTAEWEIDPDVTGVAAVPRNHWKYDGSSVVAEMTQPEKDAVDDALAALAAPTTVAGTLAFEKNNTCRNKWLGFGSSKASNRTPYIIPCPTTITALTFVNDTNSVETDIELYKNGSKIYTWELRNRRWAYKTIDLHTLEFVAGDRIGVFLRDRGTDPRNVIVTLHYVVTSSDIGEGGGSSI